MGSEMCIRDSSGAVGMDVDGVLDDPAVHRPIGHRARRDPSQHRAVGVERDVAMAAASFASSNAVQSGTAVSNVALPVAMPAA